MSTLALILIVLIAVLHLYIAWFEMFAWTTRGPKVFSDFPRDLFEPTVEIAGNQGLYNGFLALGLIWALIIADAAWQANIATFFLICVAVAGAYGAATTARRILYVQTVPAVAALAALWLT